MPVDQLLSFKNPVFANYAFYGTAVTMKMFFLALMTSKERVTRKVFANPEDVKGFGTGKGSGTGPDKTNLSDSAVERIRRNHLNDLENIPAFLFLGLFYVLTEPNPDTALWHFRVFAISRFLHTISYQMALPQPSRALCFTVGVGTCLSMAYHIFSKAKY